MPKSTNSKQAPVNVQDRAKGFDLEIDSSVKEICGVYNATSGSTRTVIYVTVLVSIIAFIAVINTTRRSWTRARIQHANATLLDDEISRGNTTARYRHSQDSLTQRYLSLKKIPGIDLSRLQVQYQGQQRRGSMKYQTQLFRDSVKLDVDIDHYLSLSRSRFESDGRVSIPLMGNSFDVNNLGYIAGITFFVLLVMLRFTLAREKDNLKIAFDTISKRYPKGGDEPVDYNMQTIAKVDDSDLSVNFLRRRFHYNSVSMSEIFNLPKLEVSRNLMQKTKIGLLVKNHLFFSPYVVYTLILANDLTTFRRGWESSPLLTIAAYTFGFFYWSAIAFLCESCNKQKRIISLYFDHFYENGYFVEKSYFLEDKKPRFSPRTAIFYIPGILIYYFNEPPKMRTEMWAKAKEYFRRLFMHIHWKMRSFWRKGFART